MKWFSTLFSSWTKWIEFWSFFWYGGCRGTHREGKQHPLGDWLINRIICSPLPLSLFLLVSFWNRNCINQSFKKERFPQINAHVHHNRHNYFQKRAISPKKAIIPLQRKVDGICFLVRRKVKRGVWWFMIGCMLWRFLCGRHRSNRCDIYRPGQKESNRRFHEKENKNYMPHADNLPVLSCVLDGVSRSGSITDIYSAL